MRKHYILAAMAALATFTACSNDDEKEMNQNVPVHFNITSESITTRATTTASGVNYSTTFDNNDEIGIYTSGLVDDKGVQSTTTDMSNAKYTYNGGTLATDDDSKQYFYPKTGKAKFYAYYPYSETAASNGVVSFSVLTDQNTGDNFKKSDFMTCSTEQASTSDAISLTMKHRLALVEVVLTNMDDASVEINGVKTGFTWTIANDAVATTGDANSTVKMYKQSTAIHWALVPQQDITQGSKLFTITHAGYTYYYTINTVAGINLEANKVNRFNLSKTVTGKIVATPNVSADSWNGLGNGEDGEVSEKNYISSLPSTLTEVTGFNSASTVDTWYYCCNNSLGLQNVTCSNASFTATSNYVNTNNSNAPYVHWANSAIIYYSSEILYGYEYELSFDISSTNSNTSQSKVQISVIAAAKNDGQTNNYDAYQLITSDALNFMSKIEGVGKSKTISITVNTSKYYNTNSPASSAQYSGELNATGTNWDSGYKLCIGLGGTTEGITYTISNLKLIKK